MADEDDPQAAMFQAVDRVAMDSGWASMALQQLAADVAGTDLTYFMLRDATIGSQVRQVRAIVSATTTNEWISHPPIDIEMRTLALSTLAAMEDLTKYRNRIVHDVWRVTPTEEVPDRGHHRASVDTARRPAGASAGHRPPRCVRRAAHGGGLRVTDVDFMRGVIHPAVQYPAAPLKSETSRTGVPIPHELALSLAAHVEHWSGPTVMTNELGRQLPPWALERAVRNARAKVDGLPDGFRFHDLRHYLASLLIAAGADVKVVQTRLRHASATTTLNTYAHMWPDADESTRAAIADVLAAREESLRNAATSSGRSPRSEA